MPEAGRNWRRAGAHGTSLAFPYMYYGLALATVGYICDVDACNASHLSQR